jgi:hypothetical protein
VPASRDEHTLRVEGFADGFGTTALVDLAKGELRHKIADLKRSLVGRLGDHQRFIVARAPPPSTSCARSRAARR